MSGASAVRRRRGAGEEVVDHATWDHHAPTQRDRRQLTGADTVVRVRSRNPEQLGGLRHGQGHTGHRFHGVLQGRHRRPGPSRHAPSPHPPYARGPPCDPKEILNGRRYVTSDRPAPAGPPARSAVCGTAAGRGLVGARCLERSGPGDGDETAHDRRERGRGQGMRSKALRCAGRMTVKCLRSRVAMRGWPSRSAMATMLASVPPSGRSA